MIGSLVGTIIYCLFISNHHIEEENDDNNFDIID
jgi:hypothetical protein